MKWKDIASFYDEIQEEFREAKYDLIFDHADTSWAMKTIDGQYAKISSEVIHDLLVAKLIQWLTKQDCVSEIKINSSNSSIILDWGQGDWYISYTNLLDSLIGAALEIKRSQSS